MVSTLSSVELELMTHSETLSDVDEGCWFVFRTVSGNLGRLDLDNPKARGNLSRRRPSRHLHEPLVRYKQAIRVRKLLVFPYVSHL